MVGSLSGTCPDTFTPSHLPSATGEAGAVAAPAEWNEQEKYTALNLHHNFTLVAIEQAGLPFWTRDFRVPEGSGWSSQTGYQGSQVILLPVAMPVCRSAAGKYRCSDWNNGQHHLPF